MSWFTAQRTWPGRLSIGGVGLRIGVSDPSHFIRQCRKHLGMTPGELRRQRGS
jgi:AraC family transcriptional activator of tynA and feaB